MSEPVSGAAATAKALNFKKLNEELDLLRAEIRLLKGE